ncbi:GAF domain-containing protein [Ruegeria sp. WL0004]|uniref:GAF domain-containing protein n=1 Tax=Ruegeria marisflavi TaxID=2984152 RepID=A0ABT2WLP6_9RHOB|nr:GAF domain-containing protein [Ruegeria sp. WL0004]MCU9836588.1 GAF domain-containing protein [Ruegeria sp. WL0004]
MFEAILERAAHLSGAPLANLCLLNAARSRWHLVAHFGEGLRHLSVGTAERPLDSHLVPAVTMRTARVVHIEDLTDTDLYRQGDPGRVAMVESEGMRTILCVPLLGEAGAIGCITLFRREVQAFTDDEIRLIETFAAQAVIAIENVRQFHEVETRLERETALAEILQVISQSRDDEWPVFDVILKSAARLCHAPLADLDIVDPDGAHLREVATFGNSKRVIPSDRWVWPMDAPNYHVEAVRTGKVIHIHDLRESENYRYGNPMTLAAVDTENMRTLLAVPLRSGDRGIGCLVLFRQEVRPFAPDEIALVETFAAQAVIAIENVRQFREVQTRLERETATRDVLEVISRSRDDDQPVFDVILDKALSLCDAPFGFLVLPNRDRTHLEIKAWSGMHSDMIDWLRENPFPLDPERLAVARAINECKAQHVPDAQGSEMYRAGEMYRRKMVDEEGFRSFISVPLVSKGIGIGAFTLYRREKRPFSPGEIALVETFAAQAVIAIENVRQFREVQTRLERETTTKNILSVISQSRDDETPVFDAILDGAARLCDAPLAYIRLITPDAAALELVAFHGTSLEFVAVMKSSPLPLDPTQSDTARAVTERTVVHIEDLAAGPLYAAGQPLRVHAVETEGMRTLLVVPLTSGETCLGTISLYRREVAPFSDDQIALVQAFAAQAVIAIENVRQFREVQQRLRRERASAEILEVISQSREDEKPVFEAILENACALCNAPLAGLILGTRQDAAQRLAAHRGMFPAAIELYDTGRMPMDASLSYAARSIMENRLISFEDMGQSELYQANSPVVRAMVDESGVRSVLFVPLTRGGEGIGNLTLFRREVKPFDQSEIALVETFAAQAVIAIENVRQFREVQERLEREKASGEILGVISQSREDETPVFDAILANACRLCDAPLAFMSLVNDEGTHFRVPAHRGAGPEMARVWNTQVEPIQSSVLTTSQAITERRIIQIEDLSALDLPDTAEGRRAQLAELEKIRSYLVIPLIRGTRAIGTINLYRREIHPFTPDQIALVETFAAQAVIAIENVRQFREVQERLERERASAEILEIISQSRDDESPVFEAILSRAARLCNAVGATLLLLNENRHLLKLRAEWSTLENDLETDEVFLDVDGESLAAEAVRTGKSRAVGDLTKEASYTKGDTLTRRFVDTTGIRSMLSVPLLFNGEAVGCIDLFRHEAASFQHRDIALVETFAAQAVIAIENVRQFKALEALNAELETRVEDQVGEIERMGRLKRFLPAAVADTVVSSGSEKMLSSHRALLGVLFCDIRGFTAFCETAEPEETIEVLQTYHQEMGKLINAHGAGVDHRMGDGIMVLFNDPLPCDDPAGEAVRLALAMRDRMADLCRGWKRLGHRLGFGVGVAMGYATVGMVGYEGRFDYTASGTAVNLAARLCDEAEDGEILLSPRASIAVEDDYAVESKGEVTLKGIREPVEIFRLASG